MDRKYRLVSHWRQRLMVNNHKRKRRSQNGTALNSSLFTMMPCEFRLTKLWLLQVHRRTGAWKGVCDANGDNVRHWETWGEGGYGMEGVGKAVFWITQIPSERSAKALSSSPGLCPYLWSSNWLCFKPSSSFKK